MGEDCTGILCWGELSAIWIFGSVVFMFMSAETTYIKAELCHFPSSQGYLVPIVLLVVQFGHGGLHWTDDLQEKIYWCVTVGTGGSSVLEK